MKQSKMTLIALVIILIGLALCTIHIVYADNQNSKEASSNDLGFMQQSFDTKQVEHTSKTKLLVTISLDNRAMQLVTYLIFLEI